MWLAIIREVYLLVLLVSYIRVIKRILFFLLLFVGRSCSFLLGLYEVKVLFGGNIVLIWKWFYFRRFKYRRELYLSKRYWVVLNFFLKVAFYLEYS